MSEAFFEPDGDRHMPTELTRGPWDPDAQHAGPPAALLGREIERVPAHGPRQVGRVTFEILRPVPIAPLRAEARVVRPGRSVELIEADLADERGVVMRASVWRLRLTELDLSGRPAALPEPDGFPGPDDARRLDVSFGGNVNYHQAIDYGFVHGGCDQPGPAAAWMRMRVPLVAGEQPSPLQRVLIAADTGNGISAVLEWGRHLYIDVDLSVHLHRLPAGEWVCLDSVTYAQPEGIGLADTLLRDERGPIGRAAQTLLLGQRD